MKIKHMLLGGFLFLSTLALQAQDKKQMALDEVINLAVTKSTEATLADTKVATSKYELENTKNNVYPEVKISGQYQRLTDPNVTLRLPIDNIGENEASMLFFNLNPENKGMPIEACPSIS